MASMRNFFIFVLCLNVALKRNVTSSSSATNNTDSSNHANSTNVLQGGPSHDTQTPNGTTHSETKTKTPPQAKKMSTTTVKPATISQETNNEGESTKISNSELVHNQSNAIKTENTSNAPSQHERVSSEMREQTLSSKELCINDSNKFSAPRGRVVWDATNCTSDCNACDFVIRVDDKQGLALELRDLQIPKTGNSDLDSSQLVVVCPLCPNDAKNSWTFDNSFSLKRLVVYDKKLIVRVSDPGASMRFILNYTAYDLSQMPTIQPWTSSYIECNVSDKHRCDKVQDCPGGEDEADCAFKNNGCDVGWITHESLCFKFLYTPTTSPIDAQQDCVRKHKGLVASFLDNSSMTFAARIVSQHKYDEIIVGLERVKTDITELNHMYRFQWWWRAFKAVVYDPIMSTEAQNASDGCVVLRLTPSFQLRQVSCSELGHYAYACFQEKANINVYAIHKSKLVQPNVTWLPDKFPTWRCSDGSFVHPFHLCHSFDPDNPDPSVSASNLPVMQCVNGLEIHYTLVCDGIDDCGDKSDEDKCGIISRSQLKEYFFCKRLIEPVPRSARCDGVSDCQDGSDEEDCPFCRADILYYFGAGCLPNYFFTEKLCMENYSPTYNFWENGSLANNASGLTTDCVFDWTFPPQTFIKVDLDGFGMAKFKLLDEMNECPETHVLCPNSYCIPVYMVNNGQHDCPYPNTDDEFEIGRLNCGGLYRCYRSDLCVHNHHLCDGVHHCPLKDDERYCNVMCPGNCTCEGYAITCRNTFAFDVERDFVNENGLMRYLDLSGSSQLEIRSSHQLSYLQFLNLSACGLHNVSLSFVSLLKVLDLSNNRFVGLKAIDLKYMNMLLYLDLSHNPQLFEGEMGLKTFLQISRFIKLRHLYLTNTGLKYLEPQTFLDMNKLRYLDITNNQIKVMDRLMFDGLKRPNILNTDEYRLCCSYMYLYPESKVHCKAPADELSSCTDLLRATFFRVFLWVLAVLAVVGNAVVLIYRLFLQTQGSSSGYRVLVSSLCLADLVMGVYLAMIGAADAHYSGQYLWKREEWTGSAACKTAGFLGLLSLEVSALTICLITLDRLLVLCFPLHFHLHLTARSAAGVCAAAWAVGFFLSAIPLMPFADAWDFYIQTGICLPLPITQKRFPGQHYSFGVFIVLNFVLFCIISVGQALIFRAIRNTRRAAQSHRTRQDMTVARRLFLVVLTDFCCWFPVCIMGLLAAGGTPIPEEINVWTAIFILPLNSALNPFLYTLNTLLDRRRKRQEEQRIKAVMSKLHQQVNTWPLHRIEDLYNHVSRIRRRLVDASSACTTPSRTSLGGDELGLTSSGSTLVTEYQQFDYLENTENTGFEVDFSHSCQLTLKEEELKEFNSCYTNGRVDNTGEEMEIGPK